MAAGASAWLRCRSEHARGGGGGASLTSSHGAVGEGGRVENGGGGGGGGVRGGTGPRGVRRGDPRPSPSSGPGPSPGSGPAASESRQEAKGSGGGGHPAGQAQIGAGVEGPRQEEVLPHDPGQGPSHLLGAENEGTAGEEARPGAGTAAAGGEAERARGEEAAAGGEPETAPGERAEGGDRPSDPEPAEAQAGEEEAAAAGGEARHAGPAPENSRAAQSGHRLRYGTAGGAWRFPAGIPAPLRELPRRGVRERDGAGARYAAPGPSGAGCWIPPLPCASGALRTAASWNFHLPKFAFFLVFWHKNEFRTAPGRPPAPRGVEGGAGRGRKGGERLVAGDEDRDVARRLPSRPKQAGLGEMS